MCIVCLFLFLFFYVRQRDERSRGQSIEDREQGIGGDEGLEIRDRG